MSHLTIDDLSHGRPMPEQADTIVIGAGMSGLYATWRILQQDPEADVFILDKGNRTGGRLDSDVVHIGESAVKEEEGGMRFTFDDMDDLMSLFMLLGIDNQVVPFPMNSGGNNRLCFRGKSFNNLQAAEDNYAVWSQLYNLAPAERHMNPTAIINTVFNRILEANPEFSDRPEKRGPEFWQKFRLQCQWNGIKLKDWSLWNLFSEMGYSNECITLLYRVSGFNGTFLSQMNAGVAYQLLEEFPADPQFRTLENGFSTLPNALVEQIDKHRIYLSTQLLSIRQADCGTGYTLAYQTVDEQKQPVYGELHANKVILGLPRLALEKLFVNSDALNRLPQEQSRKLWDTLQTATNQPLLKINLYYEKAWWGNQMSGQPEVAFGPNFSDLPLGSVYPFYAIDEAGVAALEYSEWLKQSGHKPDTEVETRLKKIIAGRYQKPAALTIYCDHLNINYWQDLQEQGLRDAGQLFDSPLQREYSAAEPQTLYAASRSVVRQATRYFKELFNSHYVPQPILTSARIWSGSTRFDASDAQQFGYGVHQWAVGADDLAVMEYLTEPLPQLYICGEAFSDYQGWVEGALRSTDRVLQQAFQLPPICDVYRQEKGCTASEAIKQSYAQQSKVLIREHIDPHFEPDHSSVGAVVGAVFGKVAAGKADSSREKERHAAANISGSVNLSYFDKQ